MLKVKKKAASPDDTDCTLQLDGSYAFTAQWVIDDKRQIPRSVRGTDYVGEYFPDRRRKRSRDARPVQT